jgi:uncharacterized protein YqeY
MKSKYSTESWTAHLVPAAVVLAALLMLVLTPFWVYGWFRFHTTTSNFKTTARYNETMDTKVKLKNALKEAMRAGDQVKKRTVRMALAAIKQVEIDRQVSLDEAAVLAILQKEIKIRREALEEARQANRPDLVAEAEAEIAVVNAFLPQAFSADELKALAEAAIAEAGAASPADMGKVMKLLMPRIQGRAPGDQVSQLVRQLLQK